MFWRLRIKKGQNLRYYKQNTIIIVEQDSYSGKVEKEDSEVAKSMGFIDQLAVRNK